MTIMFLEACKLTIVWASSNCHANMSLSSDIDVNCHLTETLLQMRSKLSDKHKGLFMFTVICSMSGMDCIFKLFTLHNQISFLMSL